MKKIIIASTSTLHDGNYLDYLLPELKHMDFIWWIRGEWIEDEKVKDILYTIRNIKGVQLVAELTPEQIKNKGHLIFE
jgi:hypothetical protein